MAAEWESERRQMVERQIRARGVADLRVLDAMRRVPRHLFVPEPYRDEAYEDRPVPIGHGQTISQPFIVGYMTELLALAPADRVLEIGTGSGYQTAVLAELAAEVWTIEVVAPLARGAALVLDDLGYRNIRMRTGDGYAGWPDAAPFDAVVATAAPSGIPEALVDQLRVGGRLVAPVGPAHDAQVMTVVRKSDEGTSTRETIPVQFVPMVRGQE